MKNVIRKFGNADGITEQPTGIDLGLSSKPKVFIKTIYYPANVGSYSEVISDLPFTPDYVAISFSITFTSGAPVFTHSSSLVIHDIIANQSYSLSQTTCNYYLLYQGSTVSGSFTPTTKIIQLIVSHRSYDSTYYYNAQFPVVLTFIKY